MNAECFCSRQEDAEQKIIPLLQTPADCHIIRFEPLLGPIKNLTLRIAESRVTSVNADGTFNIQVVRFITASQVIVSGASGRYSRPMHPSWVKYLRDQCVALGVPFNFQSWGDWAPAQHRTIEERKRVPSILIAPDGAIHPGAGGGATEDEILKFCRKHTDAIPMYRFGKENSGRTLTGRVWDQGPDGSNGS